MKKPYILLLMAFFAYENAVATLRFVEAKMEDGKERAIFENGNDLTQANFNEINIRGKFEINKSHQVIFIPRVTEVSIKFDINMFALNNLINSLTYVKHISLRNENTFENIRVTLGGPVESEMPSTPCKKKPVKSEYEIQLEGFKRNFYGFFFNRHPSDLKSVSYRYTSVYGVKRKRNISKDLPQIVGRFELEEGIGAVPMEIETDN